MARVPLWKEGLDYRHGTGHGVGAALGVHEGPQNIGRPRAIEETGFQIGMTSSNEPGYYEDGSFGIRIENVCEVVKSATPHRCVYLLSWLFICMDEHPETCYDGRQSHHHKCVSSFSYKITILLLLTHGGLLRF